MLSPLHTSGGRILDQYNNRILLAGINFETWLYKLTGVTDPNENPNGWFVKPGHMWYWGTDFGTSWDTSTMEGIATENAVRAHFQEMKNWGLNCCRMHFCIEPWINDINRAPIDQYRYHLARCAEIADEIGLYIIYDVWSYKQHDPIGAELPFFPFDQYAPPSFTEDAFASWWGEVAAYFGNAPNVIFEIFNEPHEDADGHSEYNVTTLTHWQTVHNKAIAKIRQTSQNLVIAQFAYGPDGYFSPPYGMSWIFDYPLSGGNVVYSTHIYRKYQHLGTGQPFDKPSLTTILTALRIIGPNSPVATDTAPLIIGEIGAWVNDTNDLVAFQNMLDIFSAEGIHYVGFEWWVEERDYPMLQHVAMMAPPNPAGLALRDVAQHPRMNIDVKVNPATIINARTSVDGMEWAAMPYRTQAGAGAHTIQVDEFVQP